MIELKMNKIGMLFWGACLCIALYIFFPFLKYRLILLMIAAGIFSIYAVNSKRNLLIINTTELIYILILIGVFISGLACPAVEHGETAIVYSGFFICFIIYFMLRRSIYSVKTLINVLMIFSIVFVIATYLQFLGLPVLQNFINNYLGNTTSLENYRQAELWGSYYGLASTNFENAFYISLAAAYYCAMCIISEKKWLPAIFYTLILGAIMLSGKRSLIIANLIIVCICVIVIRKPQITLKQIVRVASLVFIVIAIMVMINWKTSVFTLLIKKGASSQSLLNGREDIYHALISNISGWNFILGHGAGSTYRLFSQGAHNIYIQILYEFGVIGLLLFIAFFGLNLMRVFKLVNALNENNKQAVIICFYIQAVFVIYGFTGNPLFYNSSLMIYFLAVAIVENIYEDNSLNY